MAKYVYCSNCKAVHLASFKTTILGSDEMVCSVCRKKVKGNLIERKCSVCDNILICPEANADIELPCEEKHRIDAIEREEEQKEAARIAAEQAAQKQLDDAITYSMREISCQNCKSVVLRLKDGLFERCPNCHQVPSQEYVKYCWKKLVNQDPVVIDWYDPSGEKLIHIDQRTSNIPPKSVLLVHPNQHVVYDHDGIRTILLPQHYPIFKGEYTERERFRLLNGATDTAQLVMELATMGLSLGIGARIIFFSEGRCEFDTELSMPVLNDEWNVTIPLKVSMKLQLGNVENLLDFQMDLTDDQAATDSLKRIVRNKVSSSIGDILLDNEGDEALLIVENEYDMKRWVRKVLSNDKLAEITSYVNGDLEARYGITIPFIEITAPIRAVFHSRTTDVECTYKEPSSSSICGHINHVLNEIYISRQTFKCEKCGKRLTWCPICQKYVTTEKRPRVCDLGNHVIYR